MLQIKSRTRTGTDELTLEVLKAFMRVDGTDDDALITSLISEARDLIEAFCNITITTAEVELLATSRVELQLPYGPVQSITSVKDTEGNDMDYTYNGFYITFGSGTISVTGGNTTIYPESVTNYVTGYDTVSDGLMLGWKEICTYLYENRGDDTDINLLLRQNSNIMAYRQLIWV